MPVAKLFTVVGMSKPQSKKDVSKPFTFSFVLPQQMPEGFTESRTKGTGKAVTLPAGMSLVWSITHDGWRTFNLGGCTELQSSEFDTDQFENVCNTHKLVLGALSPEARVMWGLDK